MNALLRRLPPSPAPDDAARLSHPPWLVNRWEAAFGRETCTALLRANLERPPAYFRIPAPAATGGLLERLRAAGIDAEPTDVPRAYRLVSGSASGASCRRWNAASLSRTSTRSEWGYCSTFGPVRESWTFVPRQVARPGCWQNRHRLSELDRHLGRLGVFRRLGSRGIHLVALDAERPLPFSRQFDRVLVDAPCSGTGTLARNPEIKWRLLPDDIGDLQKRQARILGNALDAVAPGGLLVYATCSLEPEENEHVVEGAIRSRARLECAKGARYDSGARARGRVPGMAHSAPGPIARPCTDGSCWPWPALHS